ncbi:MAG TPA: HEAT repeat domain-containing protein [Polyangiaceae bacterium]|jgi:hypothetical protein
MLRRSPLLLAFAVASVTRLASAATHTVAPAGGGLPALDVAVDLATATVTAGTLRIPLGLDRAQLPEAKDVVVEPLAIGSGRHVVHVAIPAKDAEGVAWEAVVAGGQKEPLFAGRTGFTAGDPGERTGKAVRVVAHGEVSFVLVGDIREDLRVCGQDATLLDPQAIYPASLELHPVTAQRLTPEQQESAQAIVSTDAGGSAAPALARLLVARGSSVPGSRGVELTDGDPATVWSERRPHIGQGEFVTMASPRDVPIARMQIVVAPPSPPANGAAPRTFYIVTTAETFEVTLPGDGWFKPGEAYEIRFPHPLETSCVSLVLGDAYARGLAHPDVSVAELVAYSEFDAPGATLEAVARKLTGPRGAVAAQVLERAGGQALAATEKVYADLDVAGRALAIDVAASHEQCVEAAPLLVRGLCEMTGQAPRKAREKIERCKGATPALAASLRNEPATRACVAPTLAAIGGADALEPLADAMAASKDTEQETRATLRASFALALASAPPGRLGPLVAEARRSPAGRLEVMRASGPRVTEAAADCDRALDEAMRSAPSMRLRYLALGPLGELARGGDASAAAMIAGSIARDPDWPVRARAAEQGSGLEVARTALLHAVADPEPRVREAALHALAPSPAPEVVDVARGVSQNDPWPFVKTQAIGVLARAPVSPSVDDALRSAMLDPSVSVRRIALNAVAIRHTRALRDAVRDRLDDPREETEVRADAATAFGAVCDASSADHLTEIARILASPATPDELQIAQGALVGLAALHPPDLAQRLAPLLAKGAPASVRAAAERALSAKGVCR